jgi:hypothetical protein
MGFTTQSLFLFVSSLSCRSTASPRPPPQNMDLFPSPVAFPFQLGRVEPQFFPRFFRGFTL